MPRRDERAQLAYEGPMQAGLLARGAEQIGIRLSDRQRAQFAILASELVEWNRRASLTRVDDPEQIQTRHFLDSLTCALPIVEQLMDGVEWPCIDVGSGAGFPGFPLAIAFPALSMTLLEATGKKVRFLEHAVGALGLGRATVLNGRAEELARGAPHRDAYDLAVARALAPLPVALELCLPFVRPGGRLILPRGSDLPAQLESGRDAARALGARLLPPRPIEVVGLPPNRTLVVAEKTAPTPGRYPRRIGVAGKRPLDRSKLPLA